MSLSPHLECVVGMKESYVVHTVSPLVPMVLYMYVNLVTKFKIFLRLLLCMLMTSSIHM